MNETNSTNRDNPDTSLEADAEATSSSNLPVDERKCERAGVGRGNTSTLFGALFGAAAAVPT